MAVHEREFSSSSFTLQDAAHELGVNVKTLKRWVDIEGMQPIEDPRDRRRRLISRDELNRLKQLFGEVPSLKTAPPTLEARMEALEQQVSLLETALAALSTQAAAMGENIISLTQQVLELRNTNEALGKRLIEVSKMKAS
jgi:DNA-binding transcriptional MerR regulator